MQRAAIFVALIFAMLAATLHPAEAAHPTAGYAIGDVHAVHGHADSDQDDTGEPDAQGEDSLAHHHCPAAWVPEAATRIAAMPCSNALLVTARYEALSSRANDPLLEPPSA